MSNTFKTIDDNDYDDFISECEARGLDSSEFELVEHDLIETEITPTTCILNGKLTVTRGKIARTYATGDSMDWLVQFASDLRKGTFG